MINLILYILALICFIIATFSLLARVKVNFTAAGLALLTLTLVLSAGHITIGTR